MYFDTYGSNSCPNNQNFHKCLKLQRFLRLHEKHRYIDHIPSQFFYKHDTSNKTGLLPTPNNILIFVNVVNLLSRYLIKKKLTKSLFLKI